MLRLRLFIEPVVVHVCVAKRYNYRVNNVCERDSDRFLCLDWAESFLIFLLFVTFMSLFRF